MRVLIVEDEPRLARSLKKGLEREGYAVDCEANGESAWVRLQMSLGDYDLVILDVMLPGMSGLDLCRALRHGSMAVPVLMLTARDATEDKIVGLDSGADDYLVKPFDFDELLARMRTLLRRPRETLPPALVVGDLVIDPVRRTATRGGKEIELTTKEFTLLEFLARNAGLVLTREQIIAHVWDAELDSFSNLVDVHVSNLRKKIDHGERVRLL
jgi:two-component system, OmpR family, copper resistance phosphate regulon response regulator CusR